MVRLTIGTIALLLFAGAGLGISAWLSPWGAGEYAESPDGRFVAYASNMHQNRLLSEPLTYIQLTVREKQSGREVWRADYYADHQAADYTRRGADRLLRWAADGRSVLLPLGEGREIRVSTP
jgi:hypothetical protein